MTENYSQDLSMSAVPMGLESNHRLEQFLKRLCGHQGCHFIFKNLSCSILLSSRTLQERRIDR